MIKIVFTRSDNISVEFQTTLRNPTDWVEEFLITKVTLNTYLEQNLFYCFDKKSWVLNELLFFAENNLMLVKFYNKNNVLLQTYDYTSGSTTTTTVI